MLRRATRKGPLIGKLSTNATMPQVGCFSWFKCLAGDANTSQRTDEVKMEEDNNNDNVVEAARKKSMGHKLEHPDDTFDLLDMDENGILERGDIEYVIKWNMIWHKFCFCFFRILLNLWGITNVNEIIMYTSSIMKLADHDQSGKINRNEWNQEWSSIKRLLDSIRVGSMGAKRGVMSLKKNMELNSLPLYAFGNKLSFFRRPIYPDHRPKGGDIKL